MEDAAMADLVEFELMRSSQIVEARRQCPVAFLPIGPLEWHGPHLPLGTDGLHAHWIAVEVAKRVGGVVLPTYFLGSDTVRPADGPQGVRPLGFEGGERIVGMDFPDNPVKSLYIEEGTFAVVIRELLRLIKQNPYRLVVIINGHGAPNHVRTLRRLATEETDLPRVRVVYETASSSAPPPLDPGHAERGETALIMSIAPRRVDVKTLPATKTPLRYRDFGIVNGSAFDGRPTPEYTVPQGSDPRYATPEEGAAMLAREIERLADQVKTYLAESTA
jgi:creatinine amidohydrolase